MRAWFYWEAASYLNYYFKGGIEYEFYLLGVRRNTFLFASWIIFCISSIIFVVNYFLLVCYTFFKIGNYWWNILIFVYIDPDICFFLVSFSFKLRNTSFLQKPGAGSMLLPLYLIIFSINNENVSSWRENQILASFKSQWI